MAKFLGSGGVQYLWTKAKETFYENGNDITLKNGKKISVLAGDGTSTSNETVITSDGVTVGAVKNDMSDPYIGYKNAMDKDGLHIYGVDPGGNQDANERVDITSSGVKYSGAQGNGRTLKLGFEGAGFPQLTMDGNPGESKSVKIDFDDVIVQNEGTTHKLSEKLSTIRIADGESAGSLKIGRIPDLSAEGPYSIAIGFGGHTGPDAMGAVAINGGEALGAGSVAISSCTAKGDGQIAFGKLNITDTENKYACIIGNGHVDRGNNVYSNAYTIDWDGNGWFAGDVEGVKNGTTHKLSAKADKTYVDSLKPVTFTVSVPTTGWSTLTDSNGETYYKLTITASNAISTGYPVCDVVLPDDIAAARLQENAYKCINKVSVGSGNVTLYCFEEIPSVAFTIRIQIARS